MPQQAKKQIATKLFERGQRRRAAEDPAEAARLLERALHLQPHDPQIMAALASAHEEMGSPREAALALRRRAAETLLNTIRRGTKELWPYKLLAMVFSKMGEHEKAQATLAYALSRWPHQTLYFFPAGILTDNPDHREAYADLPEEEIARLVETDARRARAHASPHALTLMGHACCSRRSFQLAALCFRKEMEMYPGHEELRLHVGVCHAMLYEMEEATRWFGLARARHSEAIRELFDAGDARARAR